jgi:hypothetical protein
MSGLLPRNQGPIFSSNGTFGTVTTGFLTVTDAATINDLSLTGVASDPTAVNALTLEPDGTVTYRSIASLPFEASDIYPNATPNHTVALVTTGGNANVLLTPNGTGKVVTSAGTTFTADNISATTSGGPLTLSTVGAGSILLSPGATGAPVVVHASNTLTVDGITPTTAAGPLTLATLSGGANINLQPAAAGFVTITGVPNDDTQTKLLTVNSLNRLTYRTVGSLPAGFVPADVYPNATPNHTVALVTTGGNANVLLSPFGTGQVVVSSGTTFTADVIAPTTAATALTLETTGGNANINLVPDGNGEINLNSTSEVTVLAGTPLFSDFLSPSTPNGPLTISTPIGAASTAAGLIAITAGEGGDSTGTAGAGGAIDITSGEGGAHTSGIGVPGPGGNVNIVASPGGAQDTPGNGASGGSVSLSAGIGTDATSGAGAANGGHGGAITLLAGDGGASGTPGTHTPGSGGAVTITAGSAGPGTNAPAATAGGITLSMKSQTKGSNP